MTSPDFALNRPDQPIFACCSGLDGKPKRIPFTSAKNVSMEQFKQRIGAAFSLNIDTFHIAYSDDEGEDCPIHTDDDLTDAIWYYMSGYDDDVHSRAGPSTASSYSSDIPIQLQQKGGILLHLRVVVEYDGPSLSDASSLAESMEERLRFGGEEYASSEGFDEHSESSSRLSSGYGGGDRGYRNGGGNGSGGFNRQALRRVRDEIITEEDESAYSEEQRRRRSSHSYDRDRRYEESLNDNDRSRNGQADRRDTYYTDDYDDYEPGPSRRRAYTPSNQSETTSYRQSKQRQSYDRDRDRDRDHPSRSRDSLPLPLSHRSSFESRNSAPYHQQQGRRRSRENDPYYASPSPHHDDLDPDLDPIPGPPSSTISSELGARWLREQKARVAKKIGSSSGPGSGRGSVSGSGSGGRSGAGRLGGYGSRNGGSGSRVGSRRSLDADADGDEDGDGGELGESDDEDVSLYEGGKGELELVQDMEGKWYYSYSSNDMLSLQSRTASPTRFSPAETPLTPPTLASTAGRNSGLSTENHIIPLKGYNHLQRYEGDANESTLSGGTNRPAPTPEGEDEFEEPAGPPGLAPDCSACGLRLEDMRYVCSICGEGRMWLEGDKHNGGEGSCRSGHRHGPGSENSESESGSGSLTTECGVPKSSPSVEEQIADALGSPVGSPADEAPPQDMEQILSPSDTITPDGVPFRASPMESSSHPHSHGKRKSPHGYELCPGCIEFHGIEHTRAMGRGLSADASGNRDDGNGELVTNRRRLGTMDHTYREMIWSATGWRDIKYNDDCRCSICNVTLYQNRHKCVTCTNFNLCRSCHQNAQEIHPAHAFLAVPDQKRRMPVPRNGLSVSRNHELSLFPVKHPGLFCHNCLQDIVGPRFHCAVCPAWDSCTQCQGVTAANTGTGEHTADHIMLKIPLPLAANEVEHLSLRARERWAQEDSTMVSAAGDILSGRLIRSSSPTNETVYGGPAPRLQNAATRMRGVTVRDPLDHGIQCQACNEWIMGRRYQCANCPSEPLTYSLCSVCELRSHKLHDPLHVFIKFDRPVHFPLQSPLPILPPLYRLPVGQLRCEPPPETAGPTGYLKCVTHRSTLCDIHVGPINGVWLRCAHCPASFDICQDCEQVAEHDPTHVFVVFKSEVDMPTFRALAALSDTHSRPLIHQHVYV